MTEAMNGPRRIVFLEDDPMGLWKQGDRGLELGMESPAVPVWVIRHQSGEILTLTEPYKRGIIELARE